MKFGKKLFGTLVIPVTVLIVCLLIASLKGISLFDSQLSWTIFFRAMTNVVLVAFALSINLNSGRFDFSIGSIALLSSVLSAQITINNNLGPVAMLLLSILFGAILGFISGSVYVITKLPPIIVSLGIALFYEGMSFTLTGGHGVTFANNTNLLAFANIKNYIIITCISLLLMIIIFDYTKFGYEYKALLSGQRVSVNTGIKEVPNAIICYVIAGMLMGAQGFISATNNGSTMVPNIYISWTAVSGASKYNIYRASSASGSYSKIGTSNYNSYNDSNPLNGTNYYKVTAVNASGKESDKSSYATASYDKDAISPCPPSITSNTANASTNKIIIKWSYSTSSGCGKPTKVTAKIYEPTVKKWMEDATYSASTTTHTFYYGMYQDSDGWVKMGILVENDYGTAQKLIIYNTKTKQWILQ